jgi:hypothetical protein
MDHAPEIVGRLIWILLIGAWVYATWSGVRALRRQREGSCAGCGAAEPSKIVGASPLCVPCANKASRSHQLGYRFFLGMAIVGAVLMVVGTILDLRDGASLEPLGKTLLLMLLLGVVGPIGLALWIRRQGRVREYRRKGLLDGQNRAPSG